MAARDPSEFSKKTIETLAKRAAQTCSNPGWMRERRINLLVNLNNGGMWQRMSS